MLVRVLEKDLRDLVEVLDYERSLDTHTVARREMKAKFGGRMRHLLGDRAGDCLVRIHTTGVFGRSSRGWNSSSDTGQTVSITINKKWQGDAGCEGKRS